MKLSFNIQDIPEGISSSHIALDEGDLSLNSNTFKGGALQIEFNRTLYFIRLDCDLWADVELVCDRSLKPFNYEVETEIEIIFKVGIEEEAVNKDSIIRPFDFDSLELNIEDDIRDTILLDLPIKKIHPDYIDDDGNIKHFETKKYGSVEQDEETIDPRWNKLKQLKDND